MSSRMSLAFFPNCVAVVWHSKSARCSAQALMIGREPFLGRPAVPILTLASKQVHHPQDCSTSWNHGIDQLATAPSPITIAMHSLRYWILESTN